MSRVRVAEAALSDLRAQHAAALEKVRAERQDSATWRQERTALNRQLAELRKAKAEAAASEAAAWDRAHAAEGEAKRCKAEREIALREVRRTSSDAAEMNKKEAQIRGREARLISKLGEGASYRRRPSCLSEPADRPLCYCCKVLYTTPPSLMVPSQTPDGSSPPSSSVHAGMVFPLHLLDGHGRHGYFDTLHSSVRCHDCDRLSWMSAKSVVKTRCWPRL